MYPRDLSSRQSTADVRSQFSTLVRWALTLKFVKYDLSPIFASYPASPKSRLSWTMRTRASLLARLGIDKGFEVLLHAKAGETEWGEVCGEYQETRGEESWGTSSPVSTIFVYIYGRFTTHHGSSGSLT